MGGIVRVSKQRWPLYWAFVLLYLAGRSTRNMSMEMLGSSARKQLFTDCEGKLPRPQSVPLCRMMRHPTSSATAVPMPPTRLANLPQSLRSSLVTPASRHAAFEPTPIFYLRINICFLPCSTPPLSLQLHCNKASSSHKYFYLVSLSSSRKSYNTDQPLESAHLKPFPLTRSRHTTEAQHRRNS